MRHLLAIALLSVTLFATLGCGPDKDQEPSVACIWDHEYSAFPSIVRYRDALYVSFREGVSHIFDENGIAAGKTRILRSTDGKHWESVALLSKEGYDLRDPKLSVTADGRLMIIQGGSVYVDKKLQRRIPQVSFSSDGFSFSDPVPVDYPIPDGFAWFWRMTWHKGTGYTVSYGEPGGAGLELLKTTDGLHFEKITDIELDGFPNETTVRFLPDGRMALLIRREKEDKKAYLGISEAPFTDWKLIPLPFQIGGPEMAVLPDGSLLVGGRAYFQDGEMKTCLWRGNTEGDFKLWRTLPSGGDNSYPGFLIEGDVLRVVYYSSHELTRPDGRPRAGIYLAQIPLTPGKKPDFVSIDGTTLIGTDGKPFLIKGTNLGNWLNPEGYMFGFKKTNSPHLIDDMLRSLVGPDETDTFWKAFKDYYITEEDIAYIASTGANTIRLPFHYKLFTDEDYMGTKSGGDGFALIDRCVEWCHKYGLYLILDMHDAPGGQTGDNIDDSYGYPWLFRSETSQKLFCDIWKQIADHYKSEPVILGYELINEPIAPYFADKDELNALLEPLHKKAVAAIREVDGNHIILLGGAQWNGNFRVFGDWTYDDKIMYTCHRYGSAPTADAIRAIIEFRDKTGLPMYMGEIGHNTPEWQAAFCQTLEENNIGWTFWPYKKINGSCMVAFHAPDGWDEICRFSEAPRSTYSEIRTARPACADSVRMAVSGLIEAVRFANCIPQEEYIRSIGLIPAP